jgi:hypothetical protein
MMIMVVGYERKGKIRTILLDLNTYHLLTLSDILITRSAAERRADYAILLEFFHNLTLS